MKKRSSMAILLILIFAFSVNSAMAETLSTSSFDTVGSVVAFGRYEQDGNEENGPEDIEWIVLDIRDGKSLLVSRYALDAVPYHTENTDITWENCSLRIWLNSEFLQTAFTEAERELIPETEVDNSQKQGLRRWNNWKKTKGGNNTKDRLFLLSCLEAKQYLGVTWDGEDNPMGAVGITEYVNQKTAGSPYRRNDSEDAPGHGCIRWWLRSPGYLQHLVATVQETGVLIASGCECEDIGVRPALWLDLQSP